MKTWTTTLRWALCTGALFTFTTLRAADSNPAPQAEVSQPNTVASAPAAPAPDAVSAPVQLPYGVADVLKLSRAQVSEEIVLGYIRNSGTVYNLSPNDIVYLRDQGVSDRVVGAMLDQRKFVSDTTAQTAPPPAPAATPAPAPATAPTYADAATSAAAPTYDAAPAAVVQTQPAPSTLYVIPYPQATSGFYSYSSPYYYGPYSYWGGYYGPSVSLGFRFGGGWGHGGWHGGWHGHH